MLCKYVEMSKGIQSAVSWLDVQLQVIVCTAGDVLSSAHGERYAV